MSSCAGDLAIVVTSYLLPGWMRSRWWGWNSQCGDLIVIDETDVPEMRDGYFSITRCANIGIRRAIAEGYRVIAKTDIDCIIPHDTASRWRALPAQEAMCHRYWHVDDARCIQPRLDMRRCGTIAMRAEDWQRCGMYDEDMSGYGYDDADIQRRAKASGIRCLLVSEPRVYHIRHEPHNRETCNPVRRKENMRMAKG